MALERLRLEDYSDRELLLVLDDCADGDGYAEARDIALRLDMVGEHPHRMVAQRLSWLQRYGAVEREHQQDEHGNIRYHHDGRVRHTQRWGLTPAGAALAHGQLRKGDETALGRLKDEQMLLVARWLNGRAAAGPTSKLVDREWKRGTLLRGR